MIHSVQLWFLQNVSVILTECTGMCDTDSVQICALLTVYRHVRYLQSAQVCVILTECRCMCDTYRVYRYV